MGSNPTVSASQNLNRTLGLGSFFDSFPLLLLHITSLNRLYRLVAVCIEFGQSHTNGRFMPRKPLDVRKAYGRLFANGKQKAPWGVWSCLALCLNTVRRRGSRQAERGINSPRIKYALSAENQSFSALVRSEYISGTARCPYKRKSPDFRQGLSFSGYCR